MGGPVDDGDLVRSAGPAELIDRAFEPDDKCPRRSPVNNRLAALGATRGRRAHRGVHTRSGTLAHLVAGLDHWPCGGNGRRALDVEPLHIVWSGSEAVWIFFLLSGFVLSRRYLGPDRRPATSAVLLPQPPGPSYLPIAGSVVLAV